MSKIRQLIKDHKFAIIVAVLLSIVVVFPQVYFRYDKVDVNQGIELIPDSPWSARAREVQDGHPNFGAIYYKEGKDLPYLFQPLGSMMVGYLGQAFSLDINDTILLSRIVFPFIAFLLLYGFVLLISRDKLLAIASAALLLFADSVISAHGILRLFEGISPDNFVRLSRPVNPVTIYILFFGFLVAFWKFYKKPTWLYGILSAILLGLNYYNYFYTWTYLYSFGGMLGLFLLVQKKWKGAAYLTSVFVGGLVVGIPYIINLYQATQHPVYHDAGMRFGVVMSHMPVFVGFVVLISLVVFWFGFPRENKENYFFGLALLFAPFITLNQQIITGKVLQEAHYHWFFHKPIAVIYILIVIFVFLYNRSWLKTRKTLGIFIVLFSIFVGVFTQVHSYYYDVRDGGNIAVERQKYGPVMNWLNENVEKEAVVFGNDETSHLVVIYTPLNVFYHRVAMNSLAAPKEKLLDVNFAFYRLRDVNDGNVEEVFFEERGHLSGNIYGIHYRELLGSYENIPDEKIEEIIEQYRATLATPTDKWLEDTFKKYDVEYLVWDRKNDPAWNVENLKFLEKTADFGDLVIYKVR